MHFSRTPLKLTCPDSNNSDGINPKINLLIYGSDISIINPNILDIFNIYSIHGYSLVSINRDNNLSLFLLKCMRQQLKVE